MKILVRVPNWLGDLVMSLPFIQSLKEIYPNSKVDIIIKKELVSFLESFSGYDRVYKFSKHENRGFSGLKKFGKEIAKQEKYDVFFTLTDSLSSAIIGYFTGAKDRVGYKKDINYFFLNKRYSKKDSLHRTKQYLQLLEQYSGKKTHKLDNKLKIEKSKERTIKEDYAVLNINSEAESRRLPLEKWAKIIAAFPKNYKIVLIGTAKEKDRVQNLMKLCKNIENVMDYAGKTSIPQLIEILENAKLLISNDSGPAHLANAYNTPVIVIFGAGDENITAPYNKENLEIVRVPNIACAPCVKNICKIGTLDCLNLINEDKVLEIAKKILKDLER
jgi:lipopolysaccharide heptosyltransferase II